MKIAIVGGGPGGLYFALLMKKRYPEYDITVYERNRADDTFGFGVVFSDETLDNLMDYDRESYHAITHEFSYWDEIDFHFHGDVVRSTGHGFCGTERRALADGLADALPRTRRQIRVLERDHRPGATRRRRSHRGRRRHQQPDPRKIQGALSAEDRASPQSFHLAWKHSAVADIFVPLRGERIRHLGSLHLPVQAQHEHLGGRGARGDLEERRADARRA